MNKIGIFGMGCIGSVLSKYLQSSDFNDLNYFSRSTQERITIHHNENKYQSEIKIEQLNKFSARLDWLIVCLKEYDQAAAAQSIIALVGPETKVAVFRNGLSLKEGYLDFMNEASILETIIDCPVQRNEKAELIQFYHPKISLPQTALSKAFIKLFGESPIQFNETREFKTEQWKKLIESASLGSILAITKKTCIVFKDSKMLELYNQLIREAIEVAKLDGAEIPKTLEDDLMKKLQNYPDSKGSSMLTDVINGRPLELGAKSGAILKVAKKHEKKLVLTEALFGLLNNIQ